MSLDSVTFEDAVVALVAVLDERREAAACLNQEELALPPRRGITGRVTAITEEGNDGNLPPAATINL